MAHRIISFISIFFCSGGPVSGGSQRTFWGIGNHAAVTVVGLGDAKNDWDELEKIDGVKENIRIAVGGKHSIHFENVCVNSIYCLLFSNLTVSFGFSRCKSPCRQQSAEY